MSGIPGEYVGPGSRFSLPDEWGNSRGRPPAPVVSSHSQGYVRGAADVCVTDRCHLTEGHERLLAAGRLVEQLQREKAEMEQTAALWCDAGHAFSARDRGRKRIQVTVQDEDTGQDVTETRQFCGVCQVTPDRLSHPLMAPELHLPAPERAGRADPDRIDVLERLAEIERELAGLRDGH